MKQTADDERFAKKFAEALQPYISQDRDAGRSWAKIAADLGVTAPGLQKQLAGGTPSIRTIALAYEKYRISVAYGGIEIAKAVSAKQKKSRRRTTDNQLLLPFEITAPAFSRDLVLKRIPQGVRRYRLQIVIAR